MEKHKLDQYADLETIYGPHIINGKWIINLWHPTAQKVEIIIFDKEDSEKKIQSLFGIRKFPNFTWIFEEDMDALFYQFKITQQDGHITRAMDPFAKSMAPFDWDGKNENVGKASFVNIKKMPISKLKKLEEAQPIIYEGHIRDLTSLREDVSMPGTFKALEEIKLAEHIYDLGMTHIQFLPIHSCYALNEKDKKIIGQGKGTKGETNYNWGYDPHNYFSINGWYSSDPFDPYSRIREFRSTIKYFHKNNIKVILDVVYNHTYDNSILNNLIPGYYYRENAKTYPVNSAPLATNRIMVRRIIIDSLIHFVEYFDVDGFRFDLSTFIDKTTLEMLTKKLRKLKPNIILHGEAWEWTDLGPMESFNKKSLDNNLDFAYFNDTTRNAIKGEDDGEGFARGILAGNMDEFPNYVASIIGNIMRFDFPNEDISIERYHRWTNHPNNVLNYSACHDGHTLWDKINLTVKGSKDNKIEIYRQAIMMQQLLPGRSLYLQGTEFLYTKPNDISGQDGERAHTSDVALDIFGLGTTTFNENTYKTTDYSAGLRWGQLDKELKSKIYDFIKKINWFKQNQNLFNLTSTREINKCIKFNFVSKKKMIIDFVVFKNNKKIRIIHNFSKNKYRYKTNGELKFDSKIINKNTIGESEPHSSVLIKEDKEKW